jgi:hypothetical protein
MPHTTITVDGETIYDADPGDYRSALPERLQGMLQRGAESEPWCDSLQLPWARALADNRPLVAIVTTRPNGWTIDITTGAS